MRRVLGTIAAAAALSLVLAGTALAAPGPKWDPFGTAAWRPHTGHDSQHGLVAVADGTGSKFGGLELVRGFDTNPADVDGASFWFKGDRTGNSNGSPRIVVVFDDGGNATLRPLTWTGNWQFVDGFGAATNWDNNGGTCGPFLFNTSWIVIKTCHAGANITEVFAVHDAGPANFATFPDQTAVLDDVNFDGIVASGPGQST